MHGKPEAEHQETIGAPPLPSLKQYPVEMNRAWWLRAKLPDTGCLGSNANVTSHQLCDLFMLKCLHLQDEDSNNNSYRVVEAKLLDGKCLEQCSMYHE